MNSTCAKDGGRRQTMKERILLAKRKNASNAASKSGMFFHFAVRFELFKEFCSIHKNYVVLFNLIPFDVWFVYRCARFMGLPRCKNLTRFSLFVSFCFAVGYCLKCFCFLCFTSSVSFTGSYTEVKPDLLKKCAGVF